MPLTSLRLIVLAAVVTVGALAATVLVWPRWGRWRFLVRPSGVLLTEALLIVTVGLAVNRSQEFYPSWAALRDTSGPGPASYHVSAGRLDAWLAARPSVLSFPWRPPGWTSWHLAAAPTVTVPADYLAHPAWRYSAVLIVGTRPWALPPVAGPTVLVNVTTTASTSASTLAGALPGSLGRDLRVTSHRWALVTSAADSALARRVATAARGRFPAVAFVGVAAPARAAQTAYFPRAAMIKAALTWAADETPPPLAASAPEPAYLPPAPRRSHHLKPKPKPKAVRHGARQPRP
ncbi:hypothetical protein [Actinoplanes sp. NPDC051411]|uniref:hypothetical protein n=1 Tax=Actinoplanes sp. NPDC051411 TaxID=3155522 RepID=UPI00343C3F0A